MGGKEEERVILKRRKEGRIEDGDGMYPIWKRAEEGTDGQLFAFKP